MTRCGYLILYWINIINKHCVKGNLLSSTIALLHRIYYYKITKILIEALELKKQYQWWILQPHKPNSSGIKHHFVTNESKIDFVMSAGGHLGFMQITKIAQSGRKGNQTESIANPLEILQSCTKPSTYCFWDTELYNTAQIAKFMGQHEAHLGPVGPRWAPYWPH